MKKYLFLLIILFSFSIKADITDKQGEIISSFARNFIVKGLSNEHIDNKGMPILAYKQGSARVYGYQEILTFIETDYRDKFSVNSNKWCFDCASYVSYVLKKTLNINLLANGYLGGNPYMVSDFVSDTKNFVAIGNRNGMTANEVYNLKNQLKPGDLLIIKGLHIGMYIGNDEVAEATNKYIGQYTNNWNYYKGDGAYNLGLGITFFNSFIFTHQENSFIILRLKDGIVDPNLMPNTTIMWPDTGKFENLVIEEKKEEELPKDIPSAIRIILSTTNYTNKINTNIELQDENIISSYKILKDNTVIKEEVIDNLKDYKSDLEINDNGLYEIIVIDKLNNETKKIIEIENIDNKEPIINNMYYHDGMINIEAVDNESGLNQNPYSYDDCKSWTFKNQMEISENGEYNLCIRDKVGNIKKEKLIINDINEDVNIKPIIEEKDNNAIKFLIIISLIIVIIIGGLVIYVIKKMQQNMNNLNDDNYE